jgi:hypothetical protein
MHVSLALIFDLLLPLLYLLSFGMLAKVLNLEPHIFVHPASANTAVTLP